MPLIGRQLNYGSFFRLDDISSQFNGSTTTFNLTVSGNPFYPGSTYGIIVSISGVIQKPGESYLVSGDAITFTEAPLTDDDFFAYVLGYELAIGVPGEGTVSGSKLTSPFNYESGLLYLNDITRRVGIETTNPATKFHVQGSAYISDNLGIGTISPGAKLHVSSGNIKVDNTYGIDFSSNSNVAGMTSELLDDYEEGTFTPTVIGTTTAGSGTYTAQTGFYTKLGNRVLFQLYLVWTAHTGTGSLRATGLPFTSSNQTNSHAAITLRYDDIVTNVDATITGYISPNTVTVILNQASPTANNAANIPMDTAGGLMIAGHYYVL
jgi:hypothetical protein